ncbi:MAG: hypothetical protein R3E79_03195 [Caldilineaceae bacterium]
MQPLVPVDALVQQLHHRGPDGNGLVNLPAGTLGHTPGHSGCRRWSTADASSPLQH